MMNSFILNIRSMFNHYVRMNTIADNVSNINTNNYETKRADFNEIPQNVVKNGTGVSAAGGGAVVSVSTDTDVNGLIKNDNEEQTIDPPATKEETAYKSTNNVNLVSEFSGMIVTHAGFTASRQVLETADEMIAETLSIKQTEHSEVKGGADPFRQREDAYRGQSRLGS